MHLVQRSIKMKLYIFSKTIPQKTCTALIKCAQEIKLNFREKKDDKILNKETVVLIAQAYFLKMRRLLTPVILN